jgi:hypothetical protein
MREKLAALSKRLKDEQRELLIAAANSGALPSNSTMQRVALLEQNIAVIENTLADQPSV